MRVPDRGQEGAGGFDPMPEISQGRGTISSDIALTSDASECMRVSTYVGRLSVPVRSCGSARNSLERSARCVHTKVQLTHSHVQFGLRGAGSIMVVGQRPSPLAINLKETSRPPGSSGAVGRRVRHTVEVE